jgi:hypothetical protein
VNLLGFLGVYGKTKDTLKAWQDQQHMKERDGLHLEHYQAPASYTLTKEERKYYLNA